MDEVGGSESVPDLKDLETKVGRKTPEGLLKWMRQEAGLQGHPKPTCPESSQSEKKGLDEKIRRLKVEMAHLRAVDVRILQQLLALHEGIEAVKWLLEERGLLTSHCSSLTSSQYSLGEGPDASWRGSWSSLPDPHDKLDNISIGSYLDTLADDLDEYCPSSGAESVVCSAQLGTETSQAKNQKAKPKEVAPKEDSPKGQVKKAPEADRPSPVVSKDSNHTEHKKGNNGVLDTVLKQASEMDSPKAHLAEKLGKNLSPNKGKAYKNGKVELESCKMNGKVHLEYDAHWRWVQSQDDVTFL
ncbi:leucine rich adaptor protein 1 [Astyanax mexicanus]|uniref:Leucine rich adaptor protein 1 n=2 Tax=Astyanax mexicanus TaxID=7994 RepID=A0A3B1JX57_ASTMX|nr:leucine rich adaptor protein 1 [Astyanax mexicanus]KAG9277342.1 leucine rich adaptor protein 1-like [Astyanax mexicanus]